MTGNEPRIYKFSSFFSWGNLFLERFPGKRSPSYTLETAEFCFVLGGGAINSSLARLARAGDTQQRLFHVR